MTSDAEATQGLAKQAIKYIVNAAVFIMPLFIVTVGVDIFRPPKVFLLGVESLLLACVVATIGTRALFANLPRPTLLAIYTAAAAVCCTLLEIPFSTNERLSVETAVFCLSAGVAFAAACIVALSSEVTIAWIIVLPGVANSAIAILQRARVWTPVHFAPDLAGSQMRISALIGNPDDVGTYLVAPLLAAVALGIADRRRISRASALVAALIIAVGLIATQTLTPFLAAVFAITAVAALARPRAALVSVLICLVGASVLAVSAPPIRARLQRFANDFAEQRYSDLSSNRLIAVVAGLSMIHDHPVLGVGPGCYKYNFFSYKLRLARRYPKLFGTVTENFAEAHSDHIQIVAEGGPIAYAIFLAGIIWLGAQSFLKTGNSSREREFSRVLSLPLAVAFFVLAAAQFPLRLAVVVSVYGYLAALCFAWAEQQR